MSAAGSGALAGSPAGGSAPQGAGNNGDVPRVTKTQSKKIYAHVMPWFETPQSSGTGQWGIHWTMANKDPDQQDGADRRQVASHYYPLIGPYASGDADVVEYQLLLMKYAGIDGVLIDWPGTLQRLDYPKNVKNSEAMIERTADFGLGFAVVYEDQNIKHGEAPDARVAGRNDMSYLRDHYFSEPNYLKHGDAPLLLVFGPQVLQSPDDWGDLFSVLPQRPALLTLWYEAKEAGQFGAGEYAWVYKDNGHLDSFYARQFSGVQMGSAYPGFRAFYSEGGWGTNPFEIAHEDTATFASTLEKGLAAGAVDSIQLATWNDYGEGTMIEPTREFKYGFLSILQQKLGVSYGLPELELVAKLLELRKRVGEDSTKRAQLDLASSHLAYLRPADAKTILDAL
ncbi:MAG: hypothetical protein K0R38_5639 [Polyangiaceae bacterium]|nr:hypothetical protein [Polyangiaceae bacterium]